MTMLANRISYFLRIEMAGAKVFNCKASASTRRHFADAKPSL